MASTADPCKIWIGSLLPGCVSHRIGPALASLGLDGVTNVYVFPRKDTTKELILYFRNS